VFQSKSKAPLARAGLSCSDNLRGGRFYIVLSLLAVCSRYAASTYRGTKSTTRDGKVDRSYFASFPTHAFTASDTVIISVIGSIGEAMNPRSS
jgi:hypothetical protein